MEEERSDAGFGLERERSGGDFEMEEERSGTGFGLEQERSSACLGRSIFFVLRIWGQSLTTYFDKQLARCPCIARNIKMHFFTKHLL